MSGVISIGEGSEGLSVRLTGAKARGKLCTRRIYEDVDIRWHIITAYAARDVLKILNKVEAQQLGTLNSTGPTSHVLKVHYIGLSYGTRLALIFASLYPQRVSRMFLDGVVNAYDWTGKWQMGHLADADAVWATSSRIASKPKSLCPLWRSQYSALAGIEGRVYAYLAELRTNPAYTVADGAARLITC